MLWQVKMQMLTKGPLQYFAQNSLHMYVKCRWQAEIFSLFFLIEIQIFIVTFGFIMKNALKWVQTSLVLVQWFLR